jgi:hypothetical protein
MNWRDLLFPRRRPIADVEALADFIDERSAFLVQKGMYEYSRARAGHYDKVLFAEKDFLDALDRARWSAYPLGLAMLGELVEGILRPHAGSDRLRQLGALTFLVLSVFDRYPTPAALDPQAWIRLRADLARRLELVGTHEPKWAKDIPDPYAKTYWELMPIKKEIRTPDFPTTRSYLKIALCNMHDELSSRVDGAAVAQRLLERAAADPLFPQP